MTVYEDQMYALFRQAIVDRDAEAWASVHEQFRRMLSAWASRSFVCRDHGLDAVAIADQAFARAWAALTPERFDNFPTLSCLLNYLRTCVTTTIIDSVRQQTACNYDLLETCAATGGAPEQIVLAEMEQAALWSIVDSVVATQSERIVLIESYTYDLPPRAIHVRHPQLFATVADVYAVKRNVLNRLQRNRELRSLYAEHVQAG